MSKKIIIGAGMAGLSAGYHAQLKGIDYTIYESEEIVGGLCRTIEKDGFLFDYSGHLLHFKIPYFQKLLKELLGSNISVIERKAFIYSNGVYTSYPYQANLYGLPSKVIKECLLEFVKSYYGQEDLPTSSYKTFYDWIIGKLGVGIGKHFMFPYNEKIWTIPTKELTCEWMSEYVPRPSLDEIFNGTFNEQKKAFGYNTNFLYPIHGGIQALCTALAARVNNIRLHERVVAIDQKQRIVNLATGNREPYEQLVNSIPLKKFVGLLSKPIPDNVATAVSALRHNSLIIVNLGVRGENITDKHWIYLPEKKFVAYRVGVYSNFSPNMTPKGTTSYYIEIAYQSENKINKNKIIQKAIKDMVDIGLVHKRKDVLAQHIADIECAYVIYDKAYTKSRKIILDYLNSHGINCIGRYGNWEYTGMEEAIKQGKEVFEK